MIDSRELKLVDQMMGGYQNAFKEGETRVVQLCIKQNRYGEDTEFQVYDINVPKTLGTPKKLIVEMTLDG